MHTATSDRLISVSRQGGSQPRRTWPWAGLMRVLSMLDELMLEQLGELALDRGMYDMRAVSSADKALELLATWQPHLLLLNMDLAGPAALQQIGACGAIGERLPVIALTRRRSLGAKLAAFEAGADDVLTVPFAPDELLARMMAVVRRSYGDAATFTPVIKLGDLEIDILSRTVRDGESQLHLTSMEQSLLYLLAANAGRVVSRDEILDTLWGTDYVAESNVVDRQIRNLRTRLHDDWKQPRYIATVAGRGYQFLQSFASAIDEGATFGSAN